ncbi:hypothetical protein [Algoriphagus confluentis]|uniref:Outer membrane protein beta-barrel domain-containing protein n=1 Tax=Algoriphagus confluentis TaxID=1697556 RepID=A0ABQ6PJ26_9BACT|nr:hypothetical protein Aconfl_06070 [Algoriphagus confluentis]
MKKALLGLFFCGMICSWANAQQSGEARIHGYGVYGLRTNQFGAGGGIEYFFSDQFALMPSYTWIDAEVGNLSNFSFDLRYYFTEGVSQVYVLAGYSQTFENTQPGTAGTRRNSVGGNIGAGAYIRITDWMGLISEFRFQSQGIQQVVAKAGLAFPL